MFFTYFGVLVAVFAFILGVLQIAMGFDLATTGLPQAEIRQYLGSKTTGQAIDRGLLYILFSIVLGVLTDISRSVVWLRMKKPA